MQVKHRTKYWDLHNSQTQVTEQKEELKIPNWKI